MADELKITISAQDNASQVFKKIATEAGKVADELEKAGKDGGKGFDQVAKGADKASASFAKIDSSGNGAIRVVGEAGSAAQQTGDAFIQMGTGLQTVANNFSEWSQSAREQQQTLIGLRAAFGDTADEMISFGRSMADSNKTIFNDDDILRGERYFATLKNNYDLTNEQIQQLMQTTADLATASGVSFEDASSRVTAAIRGEGEAAEYLGLTMNQQSIDRNNLTLTMSNQEAAQFRLNALNQQAAAYSGTAAQVAQSSVGTYAAVTNQIKDMQQAVGGVIGPWASFASSMGSGLATVGEATRGITEIKTGLTGLVGVVRSSSLAMSALSLATGPVGLAILGIGAAIGAGLYLWDQQAEGARKAQKAYEEYGKAVETVDDAIANERLNGSDALANRMEETAKSIRDAQARGVSAAQEPIEQSKIDWNTVMNTKGAEETIAALTSFISDGMGKAALEWARDTGAITEEAFNNIFTNPAGNLDQIDQIMQTYWAAITPTDADAAKIEGAISKVFELMSNPKIDQAKLTAGVQEIYAELAKTGDVDAALKSFYALFTELESGASSLNNVGNAAQFAAQYIGELDASLVRANTQLAENGRLAASTGDAIAEMMRAQTGSYPEEDADRRHNNLLKERERIYHELAEAVDIGDTEKIASLTAQLKALNDELLKIVDAGKKAGDAIIGAARDAAGVLDALASKAGIAGTELVSQFGAIAISAAQATFAIEAGTAATTAWGNAAEKAVAETEKIAEAQKATITSFMEMTNNSDFVSQLNLAGLGTSYSQLAEHVNDANTAMSDGYRIIVGNTNAIAQNAQQVTDWATELINVEGTHGKIDDLLAKGTITQSQYNDAQQAYNSIAADNASIQEDILTIQAKQAPVLAELMSGTQDYVETLATMPPMQQAVALGWMDANEATKANQILTMAAAAANGELGAKGEEATTAMIQGAVAADPYLKAMLLDMGLISKGADGTITVNFAGAASTKATLDDLNTSILTLADLLDNGKLDGSIDIAVQGREEIEAALAELEALTAHNDEVINVKIVTGEAMTDSDRRSNGIDGPFNADAGRDVVIKVTADNSDAIAKTNEAQAAADKLGQTNAVVSLSATNGASSVILGAQSLADDFDATDAKAVLGADDYASDTIRGVIDLMSGFQSKTVSLNVVTQYSSVGSPSNYSGGSGLAEQHGGLLHFANGGLISHVAGEGNRPEMAHYANGGMAILPTEGLYFNPPNTYISPAPANPGIGTGAPTIVVNINAPVFGLDDLKADIGIAVAQAWMAEQQRYRREQGVA